MSILTIRCKKREGNRFELHNWATIFGIQMNYEGVTCNQAVLLCAFPEKKELLIAG